MWRSMFDLSICRSSDRSQGLEISRSRDRSTHHKLTRSSDSDKPFRGCGERLIFFGEAEAQDRTAAVLVEKRRHRDRRDAVLDDQAVGDVLVFLFRDRRIVEQLEIGAAA